MRLQSKLLSAFWGRPMYLGAIVLLPDGFDEHPDAHYPVLYYQGHFQQTFTAFRETPQTGGRGGGRGGRGGRGDGIDYPYKLYQDWTSGRLPRMIIVITQDANPFYDDSYAVNSANVGPYGDALIQELYPYVEKQFRGIGAAVGARRLRRQHRRMARAGACRCSIPISSTAPGCSAPTRSTSAPTPWSTCIKTTTPSSPRASGSAYPSP